MCEITSATITKVQNVIFWGGEGVRKAEKQVCQLATLGIKGLNNLFKNWKINFVNIRQTHKAVYISDYQDQEFCTVLCIACRARPVRL